MQNLELNQIRPLQKDTLRATPSFLLKDDKDHALLLKSHIFLKARKTSPETSNISSFIFKIQKRAALIFKGPLKKYSSGKLPNASSEHSLR
ncbi:hypothetical protein Hbal_2370 [Hirschia baltica ATCC 49814]|uniref:Uncharacterized protein n=1 Tax=Hirschia baltica (strain ATCC 49814 / DSM 5838 / IFAM 1418) TaxID=582402 RepID=C6XNA6_HIRBI|nr:hypothetical protein Hbal_2370 [Hirschia baltica ATCC 49814]